MPVRSDGERKQVVSVPGATLHVRQVGEPVQGVFIHGFGADLHTWDTLWPLLGSQRSLLRYDLRDYGCSHSDAGEPFSHVDDLVALLNTLKISQCDLVGVSMGGSIALHMALHHPQRVRKLALLSPSLVGWEWSPEWLEWWQPIVRLARAGLMDQAREMWWRHPLFDSTRDSAAGGQLYASIKAFMGRQWLRTDERPALPDVDHLHRLGVPTLLLTGGRDLPDFALIADLIEASADGVERIHLPALGHLLHLEDSAACGALISDFLSANEDSKD